MMARLSSLALYFALLLIAPGLGAANAEAPRPNTTIVVRVELSKQEMTVDLNGVLYATWAVSTARRGYRTPIGDYTPYLLARMHYSRLYDNTPMPYSIFFLRGYAIHATTEVGGLGHAVSHGCIRLSADHAKALFELVAANGLRNVSISVIE
jgi:lipoprotein-anchoring transpeptidase ErfK/SrfK